MLQPGELDRILRKCVEIGNEVADEFGFVPVRGLLERFHANLEIRPLLVEGMLASVPNSGNGSTWLVLVDKDTYDLREADVRAESSDHPLPHRLRNTIAHELVHSLAFRPAEFGLRLREQVDTDKSRLELVDDIERLTEQLSPLLLWPDKALAKAIASKAHALSVDDLLQVQRSMGISRYVLVSRLGFLRPTDENSFLFSKALRNLAVGIGEWGNGKVASVKSWPLFRNFDDNIVPSFIHKLAGQERLWADTVFPEAFSMCGGGCTSYETPLSAGTRDALSEHGMRVELCAEDREKQPGREFLFTVRSLEAIR